MRLCIQSPYMARTSIVNSASQISITNRYPTLEYRRGETRRCSVAIDHCLVRVVISVYWAVESVVSMRSSSLLLGYNKRRTCVYSPATQHFSLGWWAVQRSILNAYLSKTDQEEDENTESVTMLLDQRAVVQLYSTFAASRVFLQNGTLHRDFEGRLQWPSFLLVDSKDHPRSRRIDLYTYILLERWNHTALFVNSITLCIHSCNSYTSCLVLLKSRERDTLDRVAWFKPSRFERGLRGDDPEMRNENWRDSREMRVPIVKPRGEWDKNDEATLVTSDRCAKYYIKYSGTTRQLLITGLASIGCLCLHLLNV